MGHKLLFLVVVAVLEKPSLFLAGREPERAELSDALASNRAELIAVHGRRRVGKTYLVRASFQEQLCFELTGMRDAPLKEQLTNFTRTLSQRVNYTLEVPRSWVDAFELLKRYLTDELSRGRRRVVFLDELPWLASARSGFLSALDHFWNSFGSRQSNLILVICGSAASWMIVNVLHHKGGLHNRVTRSIALKPFNLHETQTFLNGRGIRLEPDQILEIFLAVGGIPYYLDYIRKGRSAAQSIDALFFSVNAPLRDEFTQLYASLFENYERHMKVIRALARKHSGLTRQQLLDESGFSTGGALTTVLSELESTGFILRTVPFGKTHRDALFRLVDALTLFHLRWAVTRTQDSPYWVHRRSTPAGIAWAGYAFENVCFSHVRQIKKALGISGILTEESSWQHFARSKHDHGAQIDLLIDRPDRVVNLCEMKHSSVAFVINKKYAQWLRERTEVFRRETGTSKTLFNTFITTHGVAPNEYAEELVAAHITAAALFEP
jgi:uncharacterized protein